MVIIKNDQNFVFGGFTTVASTNASWIASNDNASFLFTLINPHNIQPTILPVHNGQYTVHGCNTYGPTFGGGHDLYIANNSNTTQGSYSNLGHSYTDTTGKKNVLFTGNQQLGLINEILCFEV